MLLYLVAFTGGLLSIVSLCTLPVLPFVLTRAGQPFRHGGLPLLISMTATFAFAGSLAAIAGNRVVDVNHYGRWIAMAVFALLGLALIVPHVSDFVTRPFARARIPGSLLLGASAGILWTPCAGPILGLILAGVALGGPGTQTTPLLFAFAAGASTVLALALLVGGRVMELTRRRADADDWMRRGLGVAVLAGVVCIALGWDTGILARASLNGFGTSIRIEQAFVDRVQPPGSSGSMKTSMMMSAAATGGPPPAQPMPPLEGASQWLNGPEQTTDLLRGKVVLIHFWTYSSISCLRAAPYVEAWWRKYKDAGLVVIGIHSPEFTFEHDTANVTTATHDLGVTYPVAIDSDQAIWDAFGNRYRPALYLVDAAGMLRFRHVGEGNYEETESQIQDLLKERQAGAPPTGTVQVKATGVQAAPDLLSIQSPETHLGYEQQENYASPQPLAQDRPQRYTAPATLEPNQWALSGDWTVGGESAVSAVAGARIVFRFHARDLHLVLGPRPDGRPARFRVLIDGRPPLQAGGADVDSGGAGTVTAYRLYQLIRQQESVEDRTFQIEFLDPGVQAFAFTFG